MGGGRERVSKKERERREVLKREMEGEKLTGREKKKRREGRKEGRGGR